MHVSPGAQTKRRGVRRPVSAFTGCLFQKSESRKHESTKTRKETIMTHEFEELSSRVLAAAIDVHKALEPGFFSCFRSFVFS
jgi:hypothetical protein